MRRTGFVLLVLVSVGTTLSVRAQSVLEVDAKTIQQHIDKMAFPVYPPIAKAAHVQGTVVFDLRIGTEGRIESMKVVSGPPMLQQAATDCLQKWTFHPFEKEGSPAVAHGQYSIIFMLGSGGKPPADLPSRSGTPSQTYTVQVKSETAIHEEDPQTEKFFHESDGACKDGILSKHFSDATVSSCKRAAELAEKMSMKDNYVAKRSAFVYAATAYADVGDFKSGIIWAAKAVEVVKLGHDDDSGSNAAYSTKGTIEGLLGDLRAADRDLTTAEEFSRKGIAWIEKESPSLRAEYVRPFVRDLQFHAKVLSALNRPDEAQKKLDEAAKYN